MFRLLPAAILVDACCPMVPLETVTVEFSDAVPILNVPSEIKSSELFKSKVSPVTVVFPPV